MKKVIPGEKVIYQDEERIVQTSVKDFATGKTVVHLQGENLSSPIDRDQIKKIKEKEPKKEGKKEDPEILELRASYLEVLKKEVPSNKKNDIKWMTKKVEEAMKSEITATLDWHALKSIEDKNLKSLIADRELNIDVTEYEHADDIRVAIATELNIDIPDED